MKTLAFICLVLTGCAVNEKGEAYIQTPRVSIQAPKLDVLLWGYGVVGVSRISQPSTSSGGK